MYRDYRPILMAVVVCSAAMISRGYAEQVEDSGEAAASATPPDLNSRVKYFDFDERKLHYYEPTPMNWDQLNGVGLPQSYANGRFDEEIGHTASPSFRLDIATGNVAYEYRSLDLTVTPDSDYLVDGYIRAEKLEHAGALVTAYFVDRFGETIEGSHRVSSVVKATGLEPEIWQRVKVNVPGSFPQAYALRLQFWILQDQAWKAPDPHEIDPIERHDVYASAWFDDFSVYRLPRLTMRLSNPGGLVHPGAQEHLIIHVNNATSTPLVMRLRIFDSDGVEHEVKELTAAPVTSPEAFSEAKEGESRPSGLGAPANYAHSGAGVMFEELPPLSPGYYTAELCVLGEERAVMQRSYNFAVLEELNVKNLRYLELGVDAGRWEGGDLEGALDLLVNLGCGSVKIGVPMAGEIEGETLSRYFDQLSDLLRSLAEQRIDATGVMLPANGDGSERQSILELVESDDTWKKLCGPVFAHFGVLLPAWQVGNETLELQDGRAWTDEAVRAVRTYLKRFISIPKLAVPQALSSASASSADVVSVSTPAELPAAALAHSLEFLVDDHSTSYWLQLNRLEDKHLTPERRMSDLARRLAVSKALNPSRIYLPAPFRLSDSGGTRSWSPTPEYAAYRTLYHYLAGKTAAAVMHPAADATAILFLGPDSSTIIAWSEREGGDEQTIELYLGDRPRLVTLQGEARGLDIVDGRAQIPLTSTPVIIDGLNTPLARLQSSYRLGPTQIQVHAPEPRPTLRFENTFESQLSGRIRLTPPNGWRVTPSDISFTLAPGELFSKPLDLEIPPRQVARPHKIQVELELYSPSNMTLVLDDRLHLGLNDIKLDASLYWQENDLVLRQTLMNLSQTTVNFSAYCEPIGYPRQERFFYGVTPGDVAVQTYVFPHSRNLTDTLIPIGIEEIDGPRTLTQFAEVPK